ncbi:MAG: hypothetical protein U5L06_06945 [Rhodovibrio sp.]|nr:hypothetical protein [Rhodovibrio sp.]
MPYAHSHFQPIAELPSEYGLTIWGYATQRAPGSVDAPGFFQAFQHHLKVGDLVLVRHTGELSGPDVAERPAPVLALYGIDRDARGTIALHPIWRFAWGRRPRRRARGRPRPPRRAPPLELPPSMPPRRPRPRGPPRPPASAGTTPRTPVAGRAPAAG